MRPLAPQRTPSFLPCHEAALYMFTSVHESMLALAMMMVPLLGYITYPCLTHTNTERHTAHSWSTLVARLFQGPNAGRQLIWTGTESQWGKTLGSLVVSIALIFLLSPNLLSTPRTEGHDPRCTLQSTVTPQHRYQLLHFFFFLFKFLLLK